MTDNTGNKKSLDDAIKAIVNHEADAKTIELAKDRVWNHLQDEIQSAPAAAHVAAIRGCDDVRALLPLLRSKQLSSERSLLVRDHLQECVDCRSTYQNDSRALPLEWKNKVEATGPSLWNLQRLAVAATLLFVIGLSAYFVRDRYLAPLPGNRAVVQAATGPLYLVRTTGEEALTPGRELREGEVVRTPAGSKAILRMFDGSIVEMNERAEFSIAARRSATTINLNRGNIIVQAAKQNGGHLYVAAPDCKVSVVGTVFAVNVGMKGSRISVVEGEVHVSYDGEEDILLPGEQTVTSANMGEVAVEDEISWSQNREKHLALLAQFSKLQNKLVAIQTPGLRFNSAILPIVPQGTVVYASIPNYGEALSEANRLFQDQLKESPVLREWWENNGMNKEQPRFEEMVQKIHTLSKYLGDEAVFMVRRGTSGRHMDVVVAAKVVRPGVREFLQSELERTDLKAEDKSHIRIVDEPSATAGVTSAPGDIIIMGGSDLIVVASSPAALQTFMAAKQAGQTGFSESGFGKAIAASYQEGAGLLFAADLHSIIREAPTSSDPAKAQRRELRLQQTGVGDAQYLVVKRREVNGETDNRAMVTFSQQRRGLASWMAAPAPLGSMEFVSSEAIFAGAAAVKSPAQMVDDMLGIMRVGGNSPEEKLAEFKAEMGFDLREDLAASLGSDFAFAIDGPVLPEPSWKLVVEVNDQQRLQSALQAIVNAANREALAKNRSTMTLSQEEVDGRMFYALKGLEETKLFTVNYTFANGYMIAAPSRALLLKAIRVRESGSSLTRSQQFVSLLPKDQHNNVSAFMYQDLAKIAGTVAEQMNPQEAQSLQTIAANAKPSLIAAYGNETSIEVATNSKFFGFDVNSLALSSVLGQSKGTLTPNNP